MNPNSYCTLEASQRLVAAGISLETDYLWCETNRGWRLHPKSKAGMYRWKATIPAPSMGELWRELPGELWWENRWLLKHLYQDQVFTYAEYCGYEDHALAKQCQNTNPTDALIDLLIWVRKEADNGK